MNNFLTLKKSKNKLPILSQKEIRKISENAVASVTKMLKETKGMTPEEIKKYKEQNGYKEISEEDKKRYREMFQKAFEKARKGDVKENNSIKEILKNIFIKSK